jgi:hypothetical protein
MVVGSVYHISRVEWQFVAKLAMDTDDLEWPPSFPYSCQTNAQVVPSFRPPLLPYVSF